jgi:hypothetical protein
MAADRDHLLKLPLCARIALPQATVAQQGPSTMPNDSARALIVAEATHTTCATGSAACLGMDLLRLHGAATRSPWPAVNALPCSLSPAHSRSYKLHTQSHTRMKLRDVVSSSLKPATWGMMVVFILTSCTKFLQGGVRG